MPDRQIVVVDTETTGLGPNAAILEVAAINLSTGEELHFVPAVSRGDLANAEPDALRINRYYERGLYREALTHYATPESYRTLENMLTGNTFAGSNPTFDSRLVARGRTQSDSAEYYMGEVWHHRLLDLSAYAAGVLSLPPNELPGMAKVCELLGVENEGEHTALGDARATAECFRRLMGRQKPDPYSVTEMNRLDEDMSWRRGEHGEWSGT